MKVTFTGPQSSGKTTLLNKCKDVYGPTYRIVDEITRKVGERGFAINEDANNITQLLILNSHIENAILPGNAILDRCIIDGYIYTKYLHKKGKVNRYCVDYAYRLHEELISKYDLFFYTNPHDVPLVDDGVRSASKAFRDTIIEYFEDYMRLHDTSKFVILKGTVEERMAEIEKRLGKPLNILTPEDQVSDYISKSTVSTVESGIRLLDLARQHWNTSHGKVSIDVSNNTVTFITGGWSENEVIASALLNHPMLNALLWLQSERGGKYTFKYEQPR